MSSIQDLIPAFDQSRVSLPANLKIERIEYRSNEKRSVYRLSGFYQDLPVSLTMHRQQFKQVGKTLFRVHTSTKAVNPKTRISAAAKVSLLEKLNRGDATYELIQFKQPKSVLIKATKEECAAYIAAREKLMAYCHSLIVERARRRHDRQVQVLRAAIETVKKYGLNVVKPSHHAESDDL